MRSKIIIFFLVILVGACGSHATKRPKPYTISSAEVEKSIAYLASDELKGRMTGSEGIEKAARFIEKTFKEANLQPYYQTYRDSFEHKNLVGYNLLAYKEGKDPTLKEELVVLGAHYDHIGIIKAVEGDSIANGANDDASGTAAVLELAKYFAHKDTKRSVLFVLFSAEEMGLIGSTHLAKRLAQEQAPIYAMLNFEMIGVPMAQKDYKAYLTGYNRSDFADHFNKHAEQSLIGDWEGAKNFQLFKRSDNYPFYKVLNIPAHTISTFDFENFDQYHKVGDEIELMDIDFIHNLITESIPGIEGITNSDQKVQLHRE